MNMQPAVQPRSVANNLPHRRVGKDMGPRTQNKYNLGDSSPSFPSWSSSDSGSQSPPRDWIVYLTSCLIGHHVDVQVKNGSVYSGIFHASNGEQNFGVILKMACLTKDPSLRGAELVSESAKAPHRTLIIPADQLVQVIAKDVLVTTEGLNSELQLGKKEILLDSYISRTKLVDGERELERWVPDDDAPQNTDLDNTFTRNQKDSESWDQFKVNQQLFGVVSTFNEELYTTKLERGPQTRELEEKATRIAREIVGEDTDDGHLAEERGIYSHRGIDADEETRYSSVFRGMEDSGYQDEDAGFDMRNTDTFGGMPEPNAERSFVDVGSGKSLDGDDMLASTSSVDEIQYCPPGISRHPSHSGSLLSEHTVGSDVSGSSQVEEKGAYPEGSVRKQVVMEELRTTINSDTSWRSKKDSFGGPIPSPQATADSTVTGRDKTSSSGELPEDSRAGKVKVVKQPLNYQGRHSFVSTSSGGDHGLSPSSSVGSLSSEKSTLNPNAKEFKLNPHARSFVPVPPSRPMSPVAESSFYYPANMPGGLHSPGMPAAMGGGPGFPGHQHMMFNPQGMPMQAPQPYYPTHQPQYGQQMMMGHPRQVMFMQGYPHMGGPQ